MPYSFTKIEEEKSKTIRYVFSFLIIFYFLAAWVIGLIIKNWLIYSSSARLSSAKSIVMMNLAETVIVLAIAVCVGYIHWMISTSNLITKMIGVLKAEALNPEDRYHQMFQNILEEVSVATGGVKIEGVVVPTTAMNAFALQDFDGRNVIGITEGMLARLNRAQIEAVVGHEAAHIVSKDCLTTTVISSLFELFTGMLRALSWIGYARPRYSARSRDNDSGGAVVLVLLIYVVLMVTYFMSMLMRMFISRQKEYRADAIAVRLTRDPLSLAEALYGIGYHWRGEYLAASEMEAIFIMNPKFKSLDEQEGTFADLFSTHPPMSKRINVLLDMARASESDLAAKLNAQDNHPREKVPDVGPQITPQYKVHHDNQWQGPFDLQKLMTFDWLKPTTWVTRAGDQDVKQASDFDDIRRQIFHQGDADKVQQCPRCHVNLRSVDYEGVYAEKCAYCKGVLVHQADILRIIMRTEVGFDAEIKQLAEQIIKEDAHWNWSKARINRDPATLLDCPRCRHSRAKMHRMFYTAAYHVEIDQCAMCGLVWFDRNELEVLQYLIEQKSII